MSSNEKLGLLLGLAFITIVSFVINGLPEWIQSDTVVAPIVNARSQQEAMDLRQPDLIDDAREAVYLMGNHGNAASTSGSTDLREINEEEIDEPRNVISINGSAEIFEESREAIEEVVARSEKVNVSGATTLPEKSVNNDGKRYYVVVGGDSLSKIAKKMYGVEVGNKIAAVDAIYNANRDKLASKNSVMVGQKLVIPDFGNGAGSPVSVIGDNNQFVAVPTLRMKAVPNASATTKVYKTYSVAKNDSLWKIAQKTLGNPNRYKEIEAINADALSKSRNVLAEGMLLKLPKK